MAFILFGRRPDDAEQFLTPSFAGFVWAVIVFTFIVTFREIPEKADKTNKIVDRLKRRLRRGWYWLIAMVFVVSFFAALIFTGRLVSIWLVGYMH